MRDFSECASNPTEFFAVNEAGKYVFERHSLSYLYFKNFRPVPFLRFVLNPPSTERDRYGWAPFEKKPVANTEVTLRTICEFLELPWDPAMLTYHEKAHQHLEMFGDLQMSDGQVIPAERRWAIHERVATAPDQSRIGRWKTEMTATERQQLENLAGVILRNLGYEV